MRSLPVVAGALVLGFGLLLFLSSFRETRTHVYRSRHGETDFALEVPRSWKLFDIPTLDPNVQALHGRLPSGRAAELYLSTEPSSAVGGQDGRPTFLFPEPRRVPAGPLGILFMTGRIVRGPSVFAASAVVPEDLTEPDRALLERCLRSIRWIGR